MNIKIKTDVMLHIRENIILYLIVIFAFITGVASGGFTVSSIPYSQQVDLRGYLQQYFDVTTNQPFVDRVAIFIKVILQNAQTIFFIWFFGLFYLGLPFILITVGIRGFFLGFTVGFLVGCYGFNGFLFVVGCILPQSFIYIPCIIGMGVLSIKSGINNFTRRKIPYSRQEKLKWITSYTSKFLLFFVLLFVGSIFETFISPILFRFLSWIF